MDRQQAIRFKLMPQGHIRGYDFRKGSGITEWQIYPPSAVFHTVTTDGKSNKLLVADRAILNALKRANKNKTTWRKNNLGQ